MMMCFNQLSSVAITENNDLIVFGFNSNAECGISNGVDSSDDKIRVISKPMIHPYFKENNIKIISVDCGRYHTICSDINGNCYGYGDKLAIGYGDIDLGALFVPFKINLKEKIVQFSCGDSHSIFIGVNNNVIVCGDNEYCQCSAALSEKSKLRLPYIWNKSQELETKQNVFVEKVYGCDQSTMIAINPYKRC